jgi:quinol monooxygenase YgiN
MSQEIHVYATIIAQAGNEDAVRGALVTLAAAARTEPGNLKYIVCQDPKHVTNFYTYELYKDQAGVAAHMASPHLAAAFEQVGALLAGQPAIIETTLVG